MTDEHHFDGVWNTEAPHHQPFLRETIADRWILLIEGK